MSALRTRDLATRRLRWQVPAAAVIIAGFVWAAASGAQGGRSGPFTVKQTAAEVMKAYDEIDSVRFDPNEVIKQNPETANKLIYAEKNAQQRKDAALAKHIEAQIQENEEAKTKMSCADGCVGSGGAEMARLFQARIDSIDTVIATLAREIDEETKHPENRGIVESLRRRKTSAETQKSELQQAMDRAKAPETIRQIRERLIILIDNENSLLRQEKIDNADRAKQRDQQLEELRSIISIPKHSWLIGEWVYDDPDPQPPAWIKNKRTILWTKKSAELGISSFDMKVSEGSEKGLLKAEAACTVAIDKTINHRFKPTLNANFPLKGWTDQNPEWKGTWTWLVLVGNIVISIPTGDYEKDGIVVTLEQSTDELQPSRCSATLRRKH